MKSLTQEIQDTIAFYKSKSILSEREGLPPGTHVYCASSFVFYIPDPYFSQPPVDVETKHHFNNIAHRYVMPEGVAVQDMQLYAIFTFHEYRGRMPAAANADEKIERLYDAFIEKNPALKTIPIDGDTIENKYHVVLGAISAFNVRDIRHFVSGKTGLVSRRDPAWQVLSQRLEANGIETYWVPSMLTLRDMSQQLFSKKCADEIKSPRRPAPPAPPLP